jgi:O-methyltransferase
MLKLLKNIVRKNEKLADFYRYLVFLRKLLLRDFFDFKKLILFLRVYSMVGYEKLDNVYNLSKLVKSNNIKGDFVECGVWRGGCASVMASIGNRHTWMFDSFEGLPEPTEKDGKRAINWKKGEPRGRLIPIDRCVANYGDACKIVKKLKLDNVSIIKGWFQNTLSKAKINSISILRLDGDWYESTKYCLENLYDLVTPGGYVISDDYGCWAGDKIAFEEFLKIRNIKVDWIKIDSHGYYFKKP